MRKVSLNTPPTTTVRQPAIVITLDDGNETQYTEGFAYMSAQGIKGSIYVNTVSVDTATFVTTAQLTEMYAAGWDVANHTSDHTNLTTLDLANTQTKISTARDWLNTNGFTRSSMHVCYPFGAYNATTLAAMDALNALTGRTIVEAMGSVSLHAPYEISGYQINDAKSLATMTGYIDTAISQSRLLVVYLHAINSSPVSYDISISDFQAFIDYVVSSGIRAITINELYRGKFVLP